MKRIDDRWEKLCEQLDALDVNTMSWLDSPVVRRTITSPVVKNTHLRCDEIFQMKKAFGELENLSILEMGGGYGNCCKVMCDREMVSSYTLLDTPHMLRLAKRFLKEHNVSCNLVSCHDVESLYGAEFDLFIAATCMSETPQEYRNQIVENIWPNCKRLFVTNADQRAHPDLDDGNWDEWLENAINRHFNSYTKISMPKSMATAKQPYHWIHTAQ